MLVTLTISHLLTQAALTLLDNHYLCQWHARKKRKTLFIRDKSAATFCHQAAAWVPNMLCDFYFAKNHEIANNSTTTKAREKISTDLEYKKFFDIGLAKFENNQILLYNICHSFLGITKLLTV
jgi:hypothetical protein